MGKELLINILKNIECQKGYVECLHCGKVEPRLAFTIKLSSGEVITGEELEVNFSENIVPLDEANYFVESLFEVFPDIVEIYYGTYCNNCLKTCD